MEIESERDLKIPNIHEFGGFNLCKEHAWVLQFPPKDMQVRISCYSILSIVVDVNVNSKYYSKLPLGVNGC